MTRTILISAIAALGLSTAAFADVPRVAADIAPVHSLVARVMQGLGTPDLVVPAGASPHDHSMRPSEAMALANADLVFWMGEALTPWMLGTIQQLSTNAQVIELLEAEGTLLLPFREGVNFESHDHVDHHDEEHKHEDSHDHDDEHHEAHDGDGHDQAHDNHDHEGTDPHAWLAPANAQVWLDVIAMKLAEQDPENAALYQANAEAGKAEIETAKTQIADAILSSKDGGFVVFHDAYQYFEHSFGITAAGAIALSDASDPSPARIAEIQKVVKEYQVTCVFSEPQFNPDLVATVLEGSAAKTMVIDPMGAELEQGPEFYLALIKKLGSAMASCQ